MTASTFETAETILKNQKYRLAEIKFRTTQAKKDQIKIAAESRNISMTELIENALNWYLLEGNDETTQGIYKK